MMAYANDFVACILVNGKPQREFNDNGDRTCYIPFESEYKIRLRNKTFKRCKVEIDIDGMDALGGRVIVLEESSQLDLERFIQIDNNKGPRFKFRSKTAAENSGEVVDPDSKENGWVKVRFYPEKYHSVIRCTPNDEPQFTFTSMNNGPTGHYVATATCYVSNDCNDTVTGSSLSISSDSDEGVTCEGTQSQQHFIEADNFLTEDVPIEIAIKLHGTFNAEGPSKYFVHVPGVIPPIYTAASKEEAYKWVQKNFKRPWDALITPSI